MGLTVFTHCRAFVDEFDEIQRCAIQSWKSLAEDVQVILLGKHGADVAHDLRIDHADIPGYNGNGTALVSSIFKTGERLARHELLLEVSSDIVLSSYAVRAFEAAANRFERFMCVGARFDVDFQNKQRTQHPGSAVDYFAWRRGTLGDIPDFAVGRTAYDQWLIWAAANLWGHAVIDCTHDVLALHLNHGHPEYGTKRKMLDSEERKVNHQLASVTGCRAWMNVEHSEYVMRDLKISRR